MLLALAKETRNNKCRIELVRTSVVRTSPTVPAQRHSREREKSGRPLSACLSVVRLTNLTNHIDRRDEYITCRESYRTQARPQPTHTPCVFVFLLARGTSSVVYFTALPPDKLFTVGVSWADLIYLHTLVGQAPRTLRVERSRVILPLDGLIHGWVFDANQDDYTYTRHHGEPCEAGEQANLLLERFLKIRQSQREKKLAHSAPLQSVSSSPLSHISKKNKGE